MKTSYLIGIGIFWSAVLVLATAALVSHEQSKQIETLLAEQRQRGGGDGQQYALSEDEQAVLAASGESAWIPELVAVHNTKNDCYIIYENAVYNVTTYIPFHPGGEQEIIQSCGQDATVAFDSIKRGNGHSDSARSMMEAYFVANLGDPVGDATSTSDTSAPSNTPTTNTTPASAQTTPTSAPVTPTPTPTPAPTPTTISTNLNAATVAAHSTRSDCWMIIDGNVYNMTNAINTHPGGAQAIMQSCGRDGTSIFDGVGSHNGGVRAMLANYYLGPVGTTVETGASAETPAPANTSSAPASTSVEDAILAKYPGGTITKLSYEDDGRAEFKVLYNGRTYEGKVSASGVVSDDD